MTQMSLFTKQKLDIEQTCDCWRLGVTGGIDWEFGTSRCKILIIYIEWINKILLSEHRKLYSISWVNHKEEEIYMLNWITASTGNYHNILNQITCAVFCLVTQSCPTLHDAMDCSPPGSSVHGDSPGKITGVGCHALLQGIFPTQGSNPGLPHCRQILYRLSHQGSLRILEWVAYPFSTIYYTSI